MPLQTWIQNILFQFHKDKHWCVKQLLMEKVCVSPALSNITYVVDISSQMLRLY